MTALVEGRALNDAGGAEGWAETLRLNATEQAMVSARRGSARMILPARKRELILTGLWWAAFAAAMRVDVRQGRAPAMFCRDGFARVSVDVEVSQVEPLLTLMQAAIEFSEGK